jgi:DNA polymerase-3 subunit delta'
MALSDVIGQDTAVSILLKTICRERISSSYLFAGESGIGKKFTAMNFAKALNCQETEHRTQSTLSLTLPPRGGGPGWGGDSELRTLNSELIQFDACDECPSCRKIDAGMHPDVLLISPESGQIRIEEIRAIDEILSLKAFEGRTKVVVVDDAETMNQYAANAFLKTLEEPPSDSLIVLVSSRPDRLPDTIQSRCSRINFAPLSHEACERVIKKVIAEEKAAGKKTGKPAELNAERLSLLVRLSMGRPGNVVAGDLIEEREWFLKLLKEMMNAEKDGWASREEIEKWFDFMIIMFRDMAVLKVTGNKANIINADLTDDLTRLSGSMDLKGIIKDYQTLCTLKGYLNFNLNKSLTWNYTGSLLRKEMDVTHA